MADPRATTATPPSRHEAQPAWYVAVVVGTAVFLGGLLVSHPPIRGYQAEAVVLTNRSLDAANENVAEVAETQPAIDLAAADAWLKSDEILRKLSKWDVQSAAASAARAPSPADLAAMRENLRIECLDQDGNSRLLVRYVGRNRAVAKNVAERAAAELAGYLDRLADPRPTNAEIASLRREISLLEDQQTRLEDELIQRRFEQLAEALAKERTELARQTTAANQAAQREASQLQRRAQIAQKIDELRIEYRTLVATRQASHPRVAAVAGQIEQLEAQLREISGPSTTKAASNSRSAGFTEAKFTSVGGVERVDEASIASSDLNEVRRQLRDVVSRRKVAENRLEAALRLASSAWQKQWTVAHGGSTQRIGGSPSRNDLLIASLVGLVAATVAGVDWSGLLWGKRVLASAVHARKSLNAPLLGEIALPTAEPAPVRASLAGSFKRRIVRMAEWTLIISLFLILMAAVSQRELASQLARDPFGAMAEAFDTVRNSGW